MRLVIDLGGTKAEELHLSDEVARLQLRNVLQRHEARGHLVTPVINEVAVELHYIVTTPEGRMQYWLLH